MIGRLSLIALVMIASITALAFHSGSASPVARSIAQDTPHKAEALALDKLADLLAQHGVQVPKRSPSVDTRRYRQLKVHWETKDQSEPVFSPEPGRAPSGSLSVKEFKTANGDLPRVRALELSSTQLLVIGVDNSASLRWWHVFTDPRLIRAETVDSAGQLKAYLSYSSETDFVLAYPDDAAITQLRLYQPEWTGENFTLKPVGTLSVE
jgi:hypothetical protein